MARLENRITGEIITLQAHHTFGRRKTGVETILTSQDVSKIHASIRWEDEQWILLDHSRNGTWVNKNRVVQAERATLAVGDIIWFGGAEESAWNVLNLDSPKTMLVSIQPKGIVIEFERLCALPDEQNPEISIYLNETGRWICENREGTRPLDDGDILQHGETLWKFVAADMNDGTLSQGGSEGGNDFSLKFHFLVSLDEEHVKLQILQGNQTLELGERVHHYLLLVLARQRLADAQRGVDSSNQGWIDFQEFCSMMGMDYSYLNIQIYRARKQILQTLPNSTHLPKIVERRMGSLRFGCSNLQIKRGDQIEGQLKS